MAKHKVQVKPVMNSTGRPYIYSDSVGHLIRKAHQQASAIFQAHSAEPQLTSVQLSMLFSIATHGPLPQLKHGKLAAIDGSTLTGVVERLKDRGLIVLRSEANDKRKVILELSDEGRAVVNRMSEVVHKITETTLAPLDAVEQVALVHLLKKLTFAKEED